MICNNNSKAEFSLGIDLGSSSLKLTLLRQDGVILSQCKAGYPTDSPQRGWAQQNSNDWIDALQKAMRCLLEQTAIVPAQIRGISLCGAAHIPVLLDRKNQPTYPAILWNDGRSILEVKELEKKSGEHIRRRTSNKPSCTWTLPQLLWLRHHVPESLDNTVSFLTAKDYLVFLLTNQRVCDAGSAAATLMYDFQSGEWADELIELTGLPLSVFPEVFESSHIVGTTTRDATKFGFHPGTPVVLGCLDSVAEMISVGSLREKDSLIRLGTAGAVLNLRTDHRYNPGLLTYPFPYGGLSIKQAGTNSCGRSVDWIRELLTVSAEEFENISATEIDSDDLFFLPFLQGERTPYDNPALKGSFIGITAQHQPAHFLRAVFEGVSYSVRDCLEAISDNKELPEPIRIVGGGVRYKNWMSILSNVLDRSLIPMEHCDSAFGMAIFAAEIAGMNNLSDLLKQNEISSTPISPHREQAGIYNKRFEKYKQIAVFLNQFYHPTTFLDEFS
jgi:xylulokinase